MLQIKTLSRRPNTCALDLYRQILVAAIEHFGQSVGGPKPLLLDLGRRKKKTSESLVVGRRMNVHDRPQLNENGTFISMF